MDKNLISIIVPVYNVKKYLDSCIKSLIVQTYHNIEIILVDDGSTDGSEAICDDWEKRDKRIHVIHQRNKGLSEARNTGIQFARGNYISFVDSDDYVENTIIEQLYQSIIKNKTEMSICGYYEVIENDFIKHYYSGDDVITPKDFFVSIFGGVSLGSYAWNKLYRRELFDLIRFPEKQKFEDINTIYKLIIQCDRISVVKECLYYYVRRDNSITMSIDEKGINDQLYAIKERYEYIKRNYPELNKMALQQLYRMQITSWNQIVRAGKSQSSILQEQLRIDIKKNLKILKSGSLKYDLMACLIILCPKVYEKIVCSTAKKGK